MATLSVLASRIIAFLYFSSSQTCEKMDVLLSRSRNNFFPGDIKWSKPTPAVHQHFAAVPARTGLSGMLPHLGSPRCAGRASRLGLAL